MFGYQSEMAPATVSPAPKAEVAETPTEAVETTVVEQESAPEAEADAVTPAEATDADNSSEEVEQTESDADAETEAEEKPKKRGFARRVEKLNARIAAREQELEYWKSVALRGGEVPQQTAQPQPVAADKPKFSDFNDLEAYTEAVTDWKVQRALQAVQQQTQVQSLAQTYEQRLAQYRTEVPDFDEVMQDFVEDYGDVNVPEIVQVAMESNVGPQLAYYLAKNTEEVERIAKLPSHRRLLELGKLEDKLSQPKTQKPVAEPVKKVSAAPPPVKPVRGTGKVESSTDLADPNLSYSEWVRRREAQLRKA